MEDKGGETIQGIIFSSSSNAIRLHFRKVTVVVRWRVAKRRGESGDWETTKVIFVRRMKSRIQGMGKGLRSFLKDIFQRTHWLIVHKKGDVWVLLWITRWCSSLQGRIEKEDHAWVWENEKLITKFELWLTLRCRWDCPWRCPLNNRKYNPWEKSGCG